MNESPTGENGLFEYELFSLIKPFLSSQAKIKQDREFMIVKQLRFFTYIWQRAKYIFALSLAHIHICSREPLEFFFFTATCQSIRNGKRCPNSYLLAKNLVSHLIHAITPLQLTFIYVSILRVSTVNQSRALHVTSSRRLDLFRAWHVIKTRRSVWKGR